MFDADLEAILGEDDILLIHAGRSRGANLLPAEVDMVANPADYAENREEDDEWEDLAIVLESLLVLGLRVGRSCVSSQRTPT